MLFFCVVSLSVYFFVFCGWGSVRKYGFIGVYRSIAQSITYEVSMVIYGLCLVRLLGVYDFSVFWFFQSGWWFCFFVVYLFFGWLFIVLVEGGRTPFDFMEGESELVSGFNVEFGGVFFSFIFIYEYGFMILFRMLTVVLFCGGGLFKCFFVILFFVWVRGVLPRFRYDFLMGVGWVVLLPLSLGVFVFLFVG